MTGLEALKVIGHLAFYPASNNCIELVEKSELYKIIEKELDAFGMLIDHIYLGHIPDIVARTKMGDYSFQDEKLWKLLKELNNDN